MENIFISESPDSTGSKKAFVKSGVFITFIIPSLGRDSLKDSIQSLYELSDPSWNAVIIFDGIKSNLEFVDLEKIKIIESDKIGHAGLLRNIGMNYIRSQEGLPRCGSGGIRSDEGTNDSILNTNQPEWFGFLDDDDYLSSDYIDKLKLEFQNSKEQANAIIFRMGYPNKTIIPSKNSKQIIKCNVGISFAIQSNIAKINQFNPGLFEDYIFLKMLESKKYCIMISSYVCYFVRTKPYECDFYPKIFKG